MKHLILIDSDGTIRHTDGTISERTKTIISKIIESGNHIIICTGRPRYHTEKIAKEVGAFKIIISSNGTEIFDLDKNKIINLKRINKQSCKRLIQYAYQNDVRLILVVNDIEYVTKIIKNDNQLLLPKEIDTFLENNDIKQCMIIDSDRSKINSAKEFVIKDNNILILNESEYDPKREDVWISIADKSASKGYALEYLSKYLNIPIENTIAIGNDYNDISMFEVAGISVAVDNAHKDVKKIVKVITNSNDDDGVAEFLENWYEDVLK